MFLRSFSLIGKGTPLLMSSASELSIERSIELVTYWLHPNQLVSFMAGTVPYPLVSFMVGKLSNLLIEEARFLGAIRGQVEEMQIELRRMHCLLIDADRRQVEGDEIVKNWVAEIRELACDAEDVIGNFVVDVAASRSSSSSSSLSMRSVISIDLKRFLCVFQRCGTHHEVGSQIQYINDKIISLRNHLQAHGVVQSTVWKASSESWGSANPRITYAHEVEGDIVGVHDSIKAVVEHLKNKSNPRIVAIWGMGGLGKTRFAKEIHNHVEIMRNFDRVAWACISQQCNPRQVLEGILIKLSCPSDQERKRIGKLKPDELAEKMYSLQKEKRCLVILDDIWESKHWDTLSHAFPKVTNVGSKIVLTTRNKQVALHVDSHCFLHKLQHLTGTESMELLEMKVTSQRTEGCQLSTEMRSLGEEMVSYCGGLPLAIVILGGLLATKETPEEWEKVRHNLINCLSKDQCNGGVQHVLSLSYQDLPYHLKACFLYLSLFPEDCEIEAKALVQMWIAEGFVLGAAREEGTITMLDVGFKFLDELVNRCMVQANITSFSRRIRTCHLHDLMREFCHSKAHEENFSEDFGQSTSSSSPNTIRRLAVYLKEGQHVTRRCRKYQHVRSCLVHEPNGEEEMDSWHEINSLLKGFKILKVLNVVGFPYYANERELSDDIGKLIHLRYLRVPRAIGLPSSLGDLILLQTLDLREVGCSVPDILWKLKQLRHLYLPEFWICFTKLRLGGLSKLETLFGFDTRRSDAGDLATLPNLRKLHIRCHVKDLPKIIESPMFSKSNSLLRRSTLDIDADAQMQQEEHILLCQVLACPRVLKFSLCAPVYEDTFLYNLNTRITSIGLYGCGLKEDPMPVLGKMPNLRTLDLGVDCYIGKKMVCLAPKKMTETSCAGNFPQLTNLWLFGLSIYEWKVEEGSMPCLSELHIVRCVELKEIPDGLRFITTLQRLWVTGASKFSKHRLEEGGEDFHKIQHVPYITIEDY